MRGSRHAEVEIRKLAVAVLRLMQQEAPNLFGDYELVEEIAREVLGFVDPRDQVVIRR